jgi:flagellar hook-associated protein 2
MSTFSIGGLSSGLDTKTIISQLIEIDSRPMVRKGWTKALWTERKNAWTDLNSKLLALQGKANVLNTPGTWTLNGITSSDPSKLTGAANGPSPAAGSYAINIQQLAQQGRWTAANTLPAATGGARQSGSWYDAAFTGAGGSTLLTNLTDVDGTSLGLDAGSTISLSGSLNGSPVTASYTVGAGDTLDDLMTWAESNFTGASFTVNGDGTVSYQSSPGNEITSLSFTATNSGGSSLGIFNGTAGASSAFVAPPTGGSVADTLTITQGASTWNVSVAAGSDEATIAAAINGTAGIGVTASIVGGKLRLDSTVAGAAGDFNVSSGGTLAADLGLAKTTTGQDAKFDVNGTAYQRDKNVVTDVITDVSLNLLAATGSAVTLTVNNGTGADPAAIKAKIKDFVDSYNAVIDYINARTSEQKVANPKTLADFVKGPVSRDWNMSSVGVDLRRWVTDTITALPDDGNALDDIGINTGDWAAGYMPQNVSGRLQIDDAKLDAALAADPAKVQQVFTHVGGAAGPQDDGISRRVSDLVQSWRNGGKVDAALQGASRQISDMQDTIDRMQERLDRKRQYYEHMFASLESTLGKIQQQNNWLAGQFAALANQAPNF